MPYGRGLQSWDLRKAPDHLLPIIGGTAAAWTSVHLPEQAAPPPDHFLPIITQGFNPGSLVRRRTSVLGGLVRRRTSTLGGLVRRRTSVLGPGPALAIPDSPATCPDPEEPATCGGPHHPRVPHPPTKKGASRLLFLYSTHYCYLVIKLISFSNLSRYDFPIGITLFPLSVLIITELSSIALILPKFTMYER